MRSSTISGTQATARRLSSARAFGETALTAPSTGGTSIDRTFEAHPDKQGNPIGLGEKDLAFTSLGDALERYWGYTAFRPLQREAMKAFESLMTPSFEELDDSIPFIKEKTLAVDF